MRRVVAAACRNICEKRGIFVNGLFLAGVFAPSIGLGDVELPMLVYYTAHIKRGDPGTGV
jgi:hypothetical protein